MIDLESLLKILELRNRQIVQLNRTLKNVTESRGWRFVLFIRRLKHLRIKSKKDTLVSTKPKTSNVDIFINNLKSVKPNLILVNHETSLTGAPIVLLDLAKVIKEQKFFNISIINVHRRGPDLDVVLKDFNFIDLYDKELNEIIDVHDFVKSIYLADSQTKFFVNTITLNSFTMILKEFGFSFMTWAHELELSWAIIGIDNVKNQLSNSEKVIVDSNTLKEQITKLNISKNVEFLENGISFRISTEGDDLRRAYGLSKRDILITIAGTRSIRKGFDLFPYLIRNINNFCLEQNEKRKIIVIWIGGIESYDLNFFITKQLNTVTSGNLEVKLLSNVINYENYVNASNYFISLAREDSSPQTLFLAQTLKIPTFTLSRINDQESDIYNEIELIAKQIVLSPVLDYASTKSIGYYNTWDSYYSKLVYSLKMLQSD
jgi:hypothetical protein